MKAVTLAFGVLLAGTAVGCGTVGAPIPPEDIGVAAKLKKAQEQEREEAAKREHEPLVEEIEEEEEEALPPIRPEIGLPR
jgi:hypothetical protein